MRNVLTPRISMPHKCVTSKIRDTNRSQDHAVYFKDFYLNEKIKLQNFVASIAEANGMTLNVTQGMSPTGNICRGSQ